MKQVPTVHNIFVFRIKIKLQEKYKLIVSTIVIIHNKLKIIKITLQSNNTQCTQNIFLPAENCQLYYILIQEYEYFKIIFF